MFTQIIKRDGRIADFDVTKIEKAILKAMNAIGSKEINDCRKLAKVVEVELEVKFVDEIPDVESVQDIVEQVLMKNNYPDVAKEYILYRAKRSKVREMNTSLMKIYDEIISCDAKDSDLKRENANVDGDTAMGAMLKFGSEGAKDYFLKYIIAPEQAKAHMNGDIHIHDLDFYTLTETCCQIDIVKLFKGGYSTGHGHLREPNGISVYSALACIAIQSNQNDQHGGQSIPNFDYGLAPGIVKSYKRYYWKNFAKAYELLVGSDKTDEIKETFIKLEKEKGVFATLKQNDEFDKLEREAFKDVEEVIFEKIKKFAKEKAELETDKECYQAMEALVHNLNTMHSRAGAQVPFSSVNFGLDTSPEGRMVVKNMLLATEAGLGNGETPIFPISIFRVKEGISYNPTDPNYDLFKLACKVSAKRLFPNFSFVDAPYNLKYYKEGCPETEVAYMGCRTRVLGNVYDPTREITFGRGNLSFTTINLPRLGIESKGDINKFYTMLQSKMELVVEQLLDRMAVQSRKKVKNYPFLMGQGVWIDSDKLKPEDSIAEVIKHGTLSVGFIGLAEALIALTGKHHGESEESRKLGLEIIKYMRDYLDKVADEKKLNFSLLATPAEGLSGRFIRIDRKKYGEIKGITDKDYYTNSFHVPVYYNISAFDKISIEAPYHALTNAGHITYVELDGDTSNNVEAFEKVIRHMKESGIGYGSINHPVDRDPICGYNGIIGETCPKCGRKDGQDGVKFERIRRITGYLVGTLENFNNAKRAEEKARVKHGMGCKCGQ
ncbi:MAG: anaerobic ribonucleoside triphosphate reductase [Clostridia bacterium]|nr:anaerobic ribonucleoside triphosphate reductase [Clostridia bacterium]